MHNEQFEVECRRRWVESIKQLFPCSVPLRSEWSRFESIKEALLPFVHIGTNHCHLPGGGGMDIKSVSDSHEPGLIELHTDGFVYLAKPARLLFEHFPDDQIQSFLLLELEVIDDTGVYDQVWKEFEELCEVAPLQYVQRGVWDEGFLGHNDEGSPRPLPVSARLVGRWLHGKMLFVSKRSAWNGDAKLYQGQHNNMSAREIRSMICELCDCGR